MVAVRVGERDTANQADLGSPRQIVGLVVSRSDYLGDLDPNGFVGFVQDLTSYLRVFAGKPSSYPHCAGGALDPRDLRVMSSPGPLGKFRKPL